ncbi:MAG TPA: 4-hydroxy-tetrahydrodipicolinate reductase [Terriglobales bacterium]|nr:4-hydroxy-tetrahydrodipicolinate reductase [Terriglobales bacterium]
MTDEITARPIRIGIAGALGRMGQALTAFSVGRNDVVLAALCHRPGSEGMKVDLPGQQSDELVSMSEALAQAEVMLDFTAPEATVAVVEASVAMAKKPALVIGTTGLSAAQQAVITDAARHLTIVQSGNFSLGVNMLMGLVEQAARRLAADDWDIEILEAHHRRKVDAPSGTALMLGEASARGRGVDLAPMAVRGRDGITGVREAGSIGFATIRGGGIIGEHSVIFAAEDETLTLSHAAHDRALFCGGAIVAARWAARCAKPGLYSMMDVLGFTPAA